MTLSRSACKPGYLQVATCSLLYLLCISLAVTPPSNQRLGAATQVAHEPSPELALEQRGGEWGLNSEVWDENEIPAASAELHPFSESQNRPSVSWQP